MKEVEWVIAKRGKLMDKRLTEISIKRLEGIDKGFKKPIGTARLENAIIKDPITKENWDKIEQQLIKKIKREGKK